MVHAGLQDLRPGMNVFKYQGRPLISGAFAVAKDAVGDRVISAMVSNQLVDPTLVPRRALLICLICDLCVRVPIQC